MIVLPISSIMVMGQNISVRILMSMTTGHISRGVRWLRFLSGISWFRLVYWILRLIQNSNELFCEVMIVEIISTLMVMWQNVSIRVLMGMRSFIILRWIRWFFLHRISWFWFRISGLWLLDWVSGLWFYDRLLRIMVMELISAFM